MDIMPPPSKEMHLVQSYGAGRFVVQGQEIAENVLVWPTGLKTMGVASLEDMDIDVASHISPLPELLIVGTGPTMRVLPNGIKEKLKDQGIKCEIMDTGAACRTYNVLTSEDRRVAAFLICV